MPSDNELIVGRYKIINFPTTATMIGFGLFSLVGVIVLLLFTKEVPKENVAPLNIVIGAVIGALLTVVAYYFGDSKKSAQQQDTISTMAAAASTGTGGGAPELPPGAARTTTTTVTGPAPQPADAIEPKGIER